MNTELGRMFLKPEVPDFAYRLEPAMEERALGKDEGGFRPTQLTSTAAHIT